MGRDYSGVLFWCFRRRGGLFGFPCSFLKTHSHLSLFLFWFFLGVVLPIGVIPYLMVPCGYE